MRLLRLLITALMIAALAICFGCGGSGDIEDEQAPPPKKAPPKAAPPAAKPLANAGVSDAVKEAASISVTKSKEVLDKKGITYTYDPVNKPDPFKAYKNETLVDGIDIENPLLKYEVRYFRLVGISAEDTEPMAMFEDPNGRAYILKIGSRIGRGGGVVQSITKETVIVTETRLSNRSGEGTETVQIPIRLHPEQFTK